MQAKTEIPPQLFKPRFYCTTCPHFDKVDWCLKYKAHVPQGYYCTRPPNP